MTCSFVKFGCLFGIFLNSTNLIYLEVLQRVPSTSRSRESTVTKFSSYLLIRVFQNAASPFKFKSLIL